MRWAIDFIKFVVRPYEQEDIEDAIEIYQSSFAEQPWNEFWSRKSVEEEIEFALSQSDSIVLVAEVRNELAGILWGYRVSFEKYPFLEGKVEKNTNYWDTVAVKRDKRERGIATILGSNYLERAKQQGVPQIVGRIREEKEGTHILMKNFGFSVIPEQSNLKNRIYDTLFPGNPYVVLNIGLF